MGHLHPQKSICKLCIIVSYSDPIWEVQVENKTWKYDNIGKCSGNMYTWSTENQLCDKFLGVAQSSVLDDISSFSTSYC